MHLLSGTYSNLGGAKAPLVAQRRLNISTRAPAARQLNRLLLYCVWRVPFQHHTMRAQAAHIFMPTRFQRPHTGRILAALVMLRLFNT